MPSSPEDPILIGFGDVFTAPKDPDREFVVTRTYPEENFLYANPIRRLSDRALAIGLPGTRYRSGVEAITGKLPLREIVEGMKNGIYGSVSNSDFFKEVTRDLEVESVKPPILLRSL